MTSKEKPDKAFGFVGSMSGEAMADIMGSSAFNETIPESAFENCYYLKDNTEKENPKSPAAGAAGAEMKSSGFAEKLGAEWTQNASKNDGLPYLEAVQVPEKIQESEISIDIAIALYDKENYVFRPEGSVIHLTMDTTGNPSVFQVMEEAKEQGLLDYKYTVTAAYGSFFESINGHALQAPDGWMFKVNDVLSDVSASLKAVKDGDKLLWYQGTTQNAFQGPTWEQMTGEAVPDCQTDEVTKVQGIWVK